MISCEDIERAALASSWRNWGRLLRGMGMSLDLEGWYSGQH